MSTDDASRRAGKIVLGVDDQMENVLLLEALLASRGFSFYGAAGGQEAISLAQRVQPKLILLDIQMPGMDGFETCRRLRAMWDMKQTPIAFLTARKSAEDVRAGIAAGGNDFIVKPFDTDRLLARVDHWTGRRASAP